MKVLMAYKEKKNPICVKNYGDKAGWMISLTFILFFKYIFMEKKTLAKQNSADSRFYP